MRRANEVIGLPVLTVMDSRQLGTVENIAYSRSRDRVVGFLVDGPDRDALPFSSVREIAADTVFVPSGDVFMDKDDVSEIREALDSDIKLDGLTVADIDGDEIGTIEDTFFDEMSGRIHGFQISRSGSSFMGVGDEDERRKFYLPFESITEWSSGQVRVSYHKDDEALRGHRYPEGYDDFGEYRGRRAA